MTPSGIIANKGNSFSKFSQYFLNSNERFLHSTFYFLIVVYVIYYEENGHLLWGKCFPHSIYYEENIFLIVKFSKEIFLIFQWFIQRIKNLNFKKKFSHTKWVKTLVKIFKNGIFQKLLRIFWFIQKIENPKMNFFQYKMGSNTWKVFKNWTFQKNAKNCLICPENWNF